MTMHRKTLYPLLLLATLAACNGAATVEPAGAAPTITDQQLALEPVKLELDKPWGMDFIAAGDVLVTQQGGKLLRVDMASGEAREISGIPE